MLESGLGPDDEASEVTTGSQFQEVHLVHTHGVHAGDVAESLAQTFIFVVDDEWSATLDATTVAQFTTSGTETLRVVDLQN